MAIRRRITTTTVDEFDNSTDFVQSTDIPPSLKTLDSSDADETIPTDIPRNLPLEEPLSTPAKRSNQTTIGRTFPDLVVEFINNPRAIATILTLISFIIYVAKIDINNITAWILFPIITAVILNFVYFGAVLVIVRFWQLVRRKR